MLLDLRSLDDGPHIAETQASGKWMPGGCDGVYGGGVCNEDYSVSDGKTADLLQLLHRKELLLPG